MLFAAPALIGAHAAAVGDPDIWWHLRAGQWIAQHRAIPRTDSFSAFGAGKPRAAYSWLFELLVYQVFHHLGITGIVAYIAGLLLAITVAIHHMVRRLQRDFTMAVLLTFAACFTTDPQRHALNTKNPRKDRWLRLRYRDLNDRAIALVRIAVLCVRTVSGFCGVIMVRSDPSSHLHYRRNSRIR